MTLARRAAAEACGTAFLLAIVVGSGIMGERLAAGNAAITLLANSLATGAGLLAVLLTLGPVSGAHLNPVVTLVSAARGSFAWREVPGYLVAQFVGAVIGVFAAHAMFSLPVLEIATKARPGFSMVWSELVATAGLLAVVVIGSRHRSESVPTAVAAYITAAYWFTSSTSFANPAVTVARALTDTFTGIRPEDVPWFLLGQCIAALAASLVGRPVLANGASPWTI